MDVREKIEGDEVVTIYTITPEDFLRERVDVLERQVEVLYANLEDLAHWVRHGDCV